VILGPIGCVLVLVLIYIENRRHQRYVRATLERFAAEHPQLQSVEMPQLGPYRTPETPPETPPDTSRPTPKPAAPLILDWSNPMAPTCPRCGDEWVWHDPRKYCECDACEGGHFHQVHLFNNIDKKKNNWGCGAHWIVRAKTIKPPPTSAP